MNDLVEKVARAVGKALEREGYTTREDDGELFGDRYAGAYWQHLPISKIARAALAAIEAEGFAVVPVEPTDRIAAEADFLDMTRVSVDALYRAMIEAGRLAEPYVVTIEQNPPATGRGWPGATFTVIESTAFTFTQDPARGAGGGPGRIREDGK